MEAVWADGLLIDCSASQVIGSGGRQVQHTHELHVDVRSSSCRQTIRSSEARRDFREAEDMKGLMNSGGKMKESDAKRKEKKKRWPLELLQKGPGWPRSWRIVQDRERFGRQMMGGAEGTGITLSGSAGSYSKLRPGGRPQHVIRRVTLISVYIDAFSQDAVIVSN